MLQPHHTFLRARGDQRTVFAPDALQNDTPPVAGPGTLHLGQHPLVGPESSGVVEVNGVVEADHHTYASGVIRRRSVTTAIATGGFIVLLLFLLGDLFEVGLHLGPFGLTAGESLEGALDVPPVGEPHEVVDAGDGADEVGIAHVGQGRQVGLVVVPGGVGSQSRRRLLLSHVGRAVGDPAHGPDPLSQFPTAGTPSCRHFTPHALKRPVVDIVVVVLVGRRRRRHGDL